MGQKSILIEAKMATIESQMLLRLFSTAKKRDVYNGRIGIRVDDKEQSIRTNLVHSSHINTGPVSSFLFIQHGSTFVLTLTKDGSSISSTVTGMYMCFTQFDNALIEFDTVLDKEEEIFVYWI